MMPGREAGCVPAGQSPGEASPEKASPPMCGQGKSLPFTSTCKEAAQRRVVCPGPASSDHELPAGAESAGTGQMPLE